MSDFPPHDPNFPDVNPATGDERATEGPTSADLRRLEGQWAMPPRFTHPSDLDNDE